MIFKYLYKVLDLTKRKEIHLWQFKEKETKKIIY